MYRFLMYICLLAATSCTPAEQDFALRDKPPVLKDKCLYAGDLAALPIRAWLPDKKLDAVVLAVHGFNDYSNGFDAAGTYFARQGIAVYAYDQRGFGRSPGRGVWPGRLLQDDLSSCPSTRPIPLKHVRKTAVSKSF